MSNKTLPAFQGRVNTAGPWKALYARKGFKVYPYQEGTIAKADSVGSQASVHGIGQFAVDDYCMVCAQQSYGNSKVFSPSSSKIAKVTAVSATADTIDFDDDLTINDGDLLFNLGADTGGTSPLYDGSDITLYDDPEGTDTNSDGYVTSGDDGTYLGWLEQGSRYVFVLTLDLNDALISAVAWESVHNPFRQQVDEWWVDAVAAGASATAMARNTGSGDNVNAFIPGRDGVVAGIWAHSNLAIEVGGTLTLTLYKNGVATALTVTVTSTEATFNNNLVDVPGTYKFSAGDRLELYYSTDAGFLPDGTADIRGGLEVEY